MIQHMVAELAAGLAKVKNKISFAGVNDETTDMCSAVAPTHHFLESWSDVEAKKGHYTLIQPTIAPLFDTRQAEMSLLIWAGSVNVDLTKEHPYYEYLKQSWNASQFGAQSEFSSFQAFWDNAVHDGVFTAGSGSAPSYKAVTIGDVSKPVNSELEISYYETVHMEMVSTQATHG
jgi:hypothetical protein